MHAYTHTQHRLQVGFNRDVQLEQISLNDTLTFQPF